jgi:hypothetical protein
MLATNATAKSRPGRRHPIEPLAVPVPEACEIGGFGMTTCWELITSGKLASVKIGRRRLVLYASLKQLLQPEAA